jgi:hypothetical protein
MKVFQQRCDRAFSIIGAIVPLSRFPGPSVRFFFGNFAGTDPAPYTCLPKLPSIRRIQHTVHSRFGRMTLGGFGAALHGPQMNWRGKERGRVLRQQQTKRHQARATDNSTASTAQRQEHALFLTIFPIR